MQNYYEVQSFNKWWMRLIFIIPVSAAMYGMLSQRDANASSWSVVFVVLVLAAVGALFFFAKLETRIDDTGITIRYFPFQRVYYYVRWDEIEEIHIRKYSPLFEYGGWGLRYSLTNGKAYNVSGNKGLQLKLKSGKKFLIGTQQETALQEYLTYLKSEKKIECIL